MIPNYAGMFPNPEDDEKEAKRKRVFVICFYLPDTPGSSLLISSDRKLISGFGAGGEYGGRRGTGEWGGAEMNPSQSSCNDVYICAYICRNTSNSRLKRSAFRILQILSPSC